MTEIQHAARHAARLFWALVDFVLAWIGYGLHWLREGVAVAGLTPRLETGLMIAVVAVGVAALLRLLRGLARILFAAVVALLLARALGAV